MVVESTSKTCVADLPPSGRGSTGGGGNATTFQPVQVRIAPPSLQQSGSASLLMKTPQGASTSASSLPGALATTTSNTGIDGQQVQMCNCCPYGYHIDRDFVRFCESYRTPDGQIYQRTVKSRLVLPWDPPLNNSDPDSAVPEDEEDDVAIDIDGEIAYMHVERVVTETLEDHQNLGEYYQWNSDVSLPVMQKFRTIHESRQEEEGIVNNFHTEHATYEMKAPQPPLPPPPETSTKGIETDEVYLRNAGCQAEIVIEVPKRDVSTGVWVDCRDAGMVACVPVISTGFGNGDINSLLYRDPPEMRSTACGDGAPKQRDFCFGNNRVDKLPYVDPQLRSIGANYESDAPWIKTQAVASVMAGPPFFRGFCERGLQADLLPKPPRMCTASTQFDKKWATADVCVGEDPQTVNSVGVQVKPDVSSRTTANPWPEVRPITYEASTEAAIDPDFIEKETCSVNFANSFETILRAIYQHQIVNKEEVLEWLQQALTKDVKTAECQVDSMAFGELSQTSIIPIPKPPQVGTIGCQTVQSGPEGRANSLATLKNHATQVRPKTAETGCWTDRPITVSTMTGTELVDKCHKQTTTQPAITYTVGTSTDITSRDDGIEYRQMWSRSCSSPPDFRKPSSSDQMITKSPSPVNDIPIRVEACYRQPFDSVVPIPVSISSQPVPIAPSAEPVPQAASPPRPTVQMSPLGGRPKPKPTDTVKVDIESRIRQFEQHISSSTAPAVEPIDPDQVPRRASAPAAGSEEDLPRSNRAKPESRPVRPQLAVEVIGIKPAGRDIGLLESAVRYRSSSSTFPASPNRPLKSCLKKSFSELVGPEPQFHEGMAIGWGSSDEMLARQLPITSSNRKISFSDRVQETTVSPAATDDEDESDLDRRRKGMSDSDDSIDEGTYRIDASSGPYPRVMTSYSSSSSSSGRSLREPYQLPGNVLSACHAFLSHLNGTHRLSEIEIDSILATIAGAWFAASSQKVPDAQQVEDYMNAFKNISPILLEKITTLCDMNGNTALHYAVSQANFQIVGLLLDVPAVELNVDALNRAGYSALMLASLAEPQTPDQRDILTRLFRAGDVDARSEHARQTALMLSSAHGRLAVVDLLLACGADPNGQDADGSTALMTAAEHGYVDVVRRLLADPRIDPYLVDVEGSTALSIALNSGSKDVSVLLYSKMEFTKPRQTSEFKAEEGASSSGSVVIPVVRTSGKAVPPGQLSPTNTTVTVITSSSSSSPIPPSPNTRVQPRAPMRPSSSPRSGRRTKTVITSESTTC